MSGDKLKTFFLNHVEKIGFVLFVMFTLLILGGTRWSRYDKSPVELATAATQADARIASSTWPESEKSELTDWPDIRQRGEMMLGGIPVKNYQYTTLMHNPVYPPHVPIQQPKLFPVEKLIADSGEVLLQLPPKEDEESEDEAEESKDKTETDESDIPDAFKTKPKVAAGGAGAGAPGYGIAPSEAPGSSPGAEYGASAADMAFYGSEGGLLGGEYGGAEKVSLNGIGHQYAAVRGVLDWQGLRRNFAKALNIPLEEADRIEPVLMDFEIRRQEAVSKDDPWTGEWVKLDYQHSVDVISSAIDIEADPVDVSVTDPTITEPLPFRVYGIWGEHATHPEISQFVLSPEEQAKEQLRIDKMIEAHEKAMKEKGYVEPEQKGGFNGLQWNARSMATEMSGYGGDYMASSEAAYNSELTEYGMAPSAATGGGSSLLTSARSAAAGRLMLFRYFDFDVQPGRVYRYQVRIKYQNPNFGKPIELLASPELADAQSLFSDWSDPTPPVTIRPTAKYFLTRVNYESSRAEYVANLSVYQWNRDTGTVVHEALQTEIGDEIGSKTNTKLVNPLEETFDVETVDISTGDFLVDLFSASQLKVASSLPDLGKIPASAVHDHTVVLNSNGNLKNLDPLSRDSERRYEAKMLKFQNEKLGKEYESKADAAADALIGYGEGGEGYGGGGEGYGGRPKRSSSSRRKGGSRGGYMQE